MACDVPIRTAGFWRRFLAFGLDAGLVGTVSTVIGVTVGLVAPGDFPARHGNGFDWLVDVWNACPWLLLGPGVLFVVLLFLYDAGTLALFGTSPGRRVLGLEVVDPRGERPGVPRSLVRAALRLGSFGVVGLGVLWVALQRERRGWHDLLAGTWVGRREDRREDRRSEDVGRAAGLGAIWGGVLAVAFSAVIGLAGCGGSGAGAGVDVSEPDGGGPGADVRFPGADTPAAPDVPLVCQGPCFLLAFRAADAQPIEVRNGTQRTFTLVVTHPDTGAAAAGVPVSLRLAGPANGTSTLGATSVTTDAAGEAAVTLRADEATLPVTWFVIASAPGSADASLEVVVTGGDLGAIAATLVYVGTQPLSRVDVALLGADAVCAALDPLALPAPLATHTVTSVEAGVTFADLPLDGRYTVAATAWTGEGLRVAFGCVGGLTVVNGGTTPARIELFDRLLDLGGRFAAAMALDLAALAAAPGLAAVDDFAARAAGDDLAADVANRLRALAVSENPAAGAAALDAYGAAVRAALVSWRDQSGPSWLTQGPFGPDLAAILGATTLDGGLTVTHEGETYVRGAATWERLSLPTSPQCAGAGCPRRTLSAAELATMSPPIELLEGSWSATIANRDRLTVQTHRLTLGAGALAWYALDWLVLPAAGARPAGGLRASLAAWPDCAAVADQIATGTLAGVGLDRAGFAPRCRQAADVELAAVLGAVDRLPDLARLRLHGSARLLDAADDLLVDTIEDGEVVGYAETTDGTQGPAVTGTWSAARSE
jgi:uncharacterized RDD family membrane protein YckC